MMSLIQRYFISGLLVWLPIWVTILVINFLVNILGNTLSLLPHQYQPDALIGFHIPGINVVITVLVIFFTGIIVANFIGKRLVMFGDSIIERIPLVRTIYSSVKKVLQTLFSPGGQSFRKVLLVEFPRAGMWSLAFQTGEGTPEVGTALKEDEMISLFIPATPNPTSGFLIMLPRKDVIELKMPIDQALKFVISLGVVQPAEVVRRTKNLKKNR